MRPPPQADAAPKLQDHRMLTAYGITENISTRAGAAGYLLSATPRAELLARRSSEGVLPGGSPDDHAHCPKVVQSFQRSGATAGHREPFRARAGVLDF